MAGDWIKMRTSLLTNPKVNGIAKILEDSRFVASALSTGFGGKMHEIVTRNVMRHVTVSSLLVIWGAANEHTRDGVFNNSDLEDLDDMTGIPGFGEALESVGWAVYSEENNTVTLPNFNEYNTSGAERSASSKTAAQRQKEYRERKLLQQSDVTRDITSDVTSNRREEKRREEKKEGESTFVVPSWLPSETWGIWHKYRNSRKGWTVDAKRLSLAKLESLSNKNPDTAKQIIERSVENSWAGLFPLNGDKSTPAPRARKEL